MMGNIKLLMATVLVAFATQASANQQVNLGALSIPTTLTFGNTFASASSGSTFYDDYLFSMPDGSFNSIVSSINLNSILGLTNLQARLFAGTTTSGAALVEGWGTTANFAPGLAATTVVLNPTSLLAGGPYILQIRGTVTGTAGGSYSGALNVGPVPEPDSYAMLLGGLGFIAYSVRRKLKAL